MTDKNFVEIDSSNQILDIVILSEDDCRDSNGDYSASVGIARLNELFGDDKIYQEFRVVEYHLESNNQEYIGGEWISESNYCAPNSPWDSWILDRSTGIWGAPITKPTDGEYFWDQDAYQVDNTTGWVVSE